MYTEAMQLSRETSNVTYQIQRYELGCVTINNHEYRDSLLLMPNQLISPWWPPKVALLTVQHFAELLIYQPELVLLGTGDKLVFPPNHLFQILTDARIGVEIMDTGAACRTYTLLASEGREILAVLLK